MAERITRGFPVRGLWGGPSDAGTRVVSLLDVVPAGVGNVSFEITPIMGQRIRVEAVTAWAFGVDGVTVCQGVFDVFTGVGRPQAAAEVLTWERVLPIWEAGTFNMWHWVGLWQEFYWEMDRGYEGEQRRFAVYLENRAAAGSWMLQASFKIREM